MAVTRKIIIPTIDLTTSLVTLFTCPVNQKAQISKFTLFNYSASAVTVDIYLIASGGTATDTYRRAKDLAMAPSNSMDLGGMRQLMQPGDFIQAKCSAATSCSVKADADIIT